MLLRALRGELLKGRRNPVWLVFLVLPLFPAVLGTMNYLGNVSVLTDGWYSLWTQHTLFSASLFLPAQFGVFCAWQWRLEHTGHNWNSFLTAPVSVGDLYLAQLERLPLCPDLRRGLVWQQVFAGCFCLSVGPGLHRGAVCPGWQAGGADRSCPGGAGKLAPGRLCGRRDGVQCAAFPEPDPAGLRPARRHRPGRGPWGDAAPGERLRAVLSLLPALPGDAGQQHEIGVARGAVPGDVPARYPRLLVPVHPVDQEAGCDDRLITAPRQRSRPWPLNSWGRSKTGR